MLVLDNKVNMVIKLETNDTWFDQLKTRVHYLFCNEVDKPVNIETNGLLSETHIEIDNTLSFADSKSAVDHLDLIINKQQGGYEDTLPA